MLRLKVAGGRNDRRRNLSPPNAAETSSSSPKPASPLPIIRGRAKSWRALNIVLSSFPLLCVGSARLSTKTAENPAHLPLFQHPNRPQPSARPGNTPPAATLHAPWTCPFIQAGRFVNVHAPGSGAGEAVAARVSRNFLISFSRALGCLRVNRGNLLPLMI